MSKNLNKVREVHPVGRIVEFNNFNEVQNFVLLYSDLFYRAKDRNTSFSVLQNCFGEYEPKIYFTMVKSDWDKIEKTLGLEKIKESYRGRGFKYSN